MLTIRPWKIINEDMGSGKMKIQDEKKNYEIQSLKVNAENFNDHFINIAKILQIKLSMIKLK
jgi:hypothetical protein